MAVQTLYSATKTVGTYVRARIVVVENSIDITNNMSNITVYVQMWRTNTGYTTKATGTLTLNIGGTNYTHSITTSQAITYNSYTTIGGSTTLNVLHNDDGSKTIEITASSSTNNSNMTFSSFGGGFVLSTIPRSSTPSISGTLQIGSTITINTNRASDSFVHNIYVSWGSQINNQRILTGIGASSTWTIPKDYANYIPNGDSGTLYITCETYNGSTKVGDKTINTNVSLPDTSEFKPKVTNINLWENSGSGVPSTWGIYVQNASKISYEVSASGAYSSTISKYSVVVNGMTYYSQAYTTDYLKLDGTNTIVVTVTDSRGRTASLSKTFEVVTYGGPKINKFNVNRCDEDGTDNDEGDYAKIEINSVVPKLNNKNSYSYYLKKKTSEQTNYEVIDVTITETTDDTNYILNKTLIIPTDGNNTFDFMFILADSLKSINNFENIDTAFQLINFNESGKGLALGKVSKKNALEINMDIYDKFDQLIPNGLAEYETTGIDPNTTLKHLILTTTNVPDNSFYYVITLFYANKSINANRTQIAVPYIYQLSQNKRTIYIRQNVGGTWNSWVAI